MPRTRPNSWGDSFKPGQCVREIVPRTIRPGMRVRPRIARRGVYERFATPVETEQLGMSGYGVVIRTADGKRSVIRYDNAIPCDTRDPRGTSRDPRGRR